MLCVPCSLCFSFSGWRIRVILIHPKVLIHPKLCEWDILSSFVIQCAVANDVYKLRLCAQQLIALLITRPVNFLFNGINDICLLIKLISMNCINSCQKNHTNEDSVGHYIIADGQVIPRSH